MACPALGPDRRPAPASTRVGGQRHYHSRYHRQQTAQRRCYYYHPWQPRHWRQVPCEQTVRRQCQRTRMTTSATGSSRAPHTPVDNSSQATDTAQDDGGGGSRMHDPRSNKQQRHGTQHGPWTKQTAKAWRTIRPAAPTWLPRLRPSSTRGGGPLPDRTTHQVPETVEAPLHWQVRCQSRVLSRHCTASITRHDPKPGQSCHTAARSDKQGGCHDNAQHRSQGEQV